MMGIKKYLSRFSLSDRRKRAAELIDRQIAAGNSLRRRIENLRGKDQKLLPRDQWVPITEVVAWQQNGRAVIVELFGESTSQIRNWDKMWSEDPPSSPYDEYEEDNYLNRIGQINAYLDGLKADPSLSGNAIDKFKDKIAQHPVLGPVVAISGILATVFAVWRGVAWIAEKYFSP